jgi:hypothetical protein
MWAGVQNVSRPIDMCHEISQFAPIVAEVTASTAHHIYQGIAFCLLETRLCSDVPDAESVALAI